MTDLNIHIGCHGVLPFAISSAFEAVTRSKAAKVVKQINIRDYRKYWRDAVLVGSRSSILGAQESELTKRVIADRGSLYVLSNERLMAGDRSIFKNGCIYPDAERRVSNLVETLIELTPVLKLFICNMDNFATINGIVPDCIASCDSLPWSNLIRRICTAIAPDQVEIYAINDPIKFAGILPSILFDIPAGFLNDFTPDPTDKLVQLVSKSFPTASATSIVRYQADLDEISRIDRANLYVI